MNFERNSEPRGHISLIIIIIIIIIINDLAISWSASLRVAKS